MATTRVTVIHNNSEYRALGNNPGVADALDDACDEIKDEIKRRIHNRTGRARDSVSVDRTISAEGPSADIRMMWYMRFVDQGTKYIHAQHIVEDAVDAVAARH